MIALKHYVTDRQHKLKSMVCFYTVLLLKFFTIISGDLKHILYAN